MLAPKLVAQDGLVVVPFEIRHALWIFNIPRYNQPTDDGMRQMMLWAAAQKDSRGWTALKDGVPIGCGSITRLRPKVGYGWAFIGNIKGHEKWFVRITEAMMQCVVTEFCFERVEACINIDFAQSIRWLELLGFENETPKGMRKAGINGETIVSMARIF